MPNEDYDIAKAFKVIENDLIASMIRNLKHHRAEEEKEGKEWTQWQVEQLQALEKYKKENAEKYNKQFKSINAQIGEMIRAAKEAGSTEQEIAILNAIKNGFKATKKTRKELTGEFFKLNERKLDALIKATTDDMKKAETAILRMANDKYRKIIFNAQVYANTGAGTYEKAVDMATRDMLNAGLNCVQYANKARHTLSDYADMAIRTANKRAYLQGEGEKRQEWGISTVIMNKRGNACPKCLPFVGKVMIDDVWSGGMKTDGAYLLMSNAIAQGLYHPRCKDSHTTYFPGISTPGAAYTKAELEQIESDYKEEQKEQYARRQAERFERLTKYSLDKDNSEYYKRHEQGWRRKAMEKQKIEEQQNIENASTLEENKGKWGNKERGWRRNHLKLDEENKAINKYGREILFEIKSKKQERVADAKRLLIELSSEYDTYLAQVTMGARKCAGSVGIGGDMNLNTLSEDVIYHEFAHTLAMQGRVRCGLADAKEEKFEKELAKLFTQYKKDTSNDYKFALSGYSFTNKDEFMAEGFAIAKLKDAGKNMPVQYQNIGDDTYCYKVKNLIDKYFKKELVAKFGKDDIMEAHKSVFEGIPKNWKKIDSDVDAVRNANPLYKPDNEYSRNCPNCVCAYELRKRGYDVTAQPATNNHVLNRNPEMAWIDAEVRTTEGNGLSNILDAMTELDNGARFEIATISQRGMGHVFVCEKVNGKVKFFDPQKGCELQEDIFDTVRKDSTKYWRIDNLELSDRGITACIGR